MVTQLTGSFISLRPCVGGQKLVPGDNPLTLVTSYCRCIDTIDYTYTTQPLMDQPETTGECPIQQ